MILDTVHLPFLGSRLEDHVTFQYLLEAVEEGTATLLMPRWVVHRELLRAGDRIAFHLALTVGSACFDRGLIRSVAWDAALDSQRCDVSLEADGPPASAVSLVCRDACLFVEMAPEASPLEKLAEILQAAVVLKKGVAIYLDRLIPYFSRVSGYPVEEYPQLRASFLEEVKGRVTAHRTALEGWAERAAREIRRPADIPRVLDLEEIRSGFESEISLELFRIAFANDKVTAYVQALKELEGRLYEHYNLLVLLYVRSL